MNDSKRTFLSIRRIYAILLILVLFGSAGEAQIRFQKLYGGAMDEWGVRVCERASGGYILGGYTRSFGAGLFDLYLIRTDINGDTVWTRTYGDATLNTINWLNETSDGGVIISAFMNYDIIIIKIDASGDVQWKRSFGISIGTGGHSVIQTFDGGFVFTANYMFGTLLIKLDPLGTTLWAKVINVSTDIYTPCVTQTPDSGFVLVGSVNESSTLPSTVDYCIFRTDKFGNLIGAKRFGIQNEDDIGYSVAAIPGGYIMAGYSSAPAINGMTLTRLDNIGNSIWSKRYNAGQQSLMAHQRITLDVLSNGYLLSTEATSTTDRLCMYKTDSLGNIDWVHSFMYQFNVYGRAGNAIPTQDGGFACLGTFYNWSSLNGYKIAFIKTDSLGWSGCNEQSLSITGTPVVFPSQNFIFNQTVYNDSTVVTSLNISEGGVVTTECTSVGVMEHPFSFKVDIFPNPFSDKLIIHELKGSSEITIYDISGKLISCTHASAGEITLNTSTLTPGFYLLKITDAQNSFAQKILKVHD